MAKRFKNMLIMVFKRLLSLNLCKNFDVLTKRMQNVNADIQGQVAHGSKKGTATNVL